MSARQRIVYESVLLLWTVVALVVLAPGLKEKLLETSFIKAMFKCQSILDKRTCREMLSYIMVHRLFLAIALYHFFLACSVLPNLPALRQRLQNHCWIFKLVILVVAIIAALFIPQHSYFIVYFPYVVMIGGSLFLVFQFFLLVDIAETVVAWATAQQHQARKSKIPSKLLLYLLVLKSFELFALSFGIVAFILATTSNQDCTWNDIFIAFILGACFISFGISLHPRIRLDLRPAVIFLPCAVVIFHSVFVMVVALSTQDNPGCNLERTFLSGKELRIGGNLRVIVALFVMHTTLFYECLRNNDNYSFTLRLLRDTDIDKGLIEEEDENEEDLPYRYPAFHFLILTASLYTVATLTNWCGPVINRFSPSDKSILIELQTHWKPAQIVTMVTCCAPVLLYICLMIFAIVTREPQFYQPQVLSGNYSSRAPDESLKSINSFSPCTNRKSFNKNKRNNDANDEIDLGAACEMLRTGNERESKHDLSSQSYGENLVIRCRKIRDTSINFYHFPREISQSYYGGRNGSNACTVIAVLIARTFCCGSIKPQQTESLKDSWINLVSSCIAEGNRLYDMLINSKKQGAIYLSVEDVVEEFGNTLQVKNLGCSLPVSFVSETETATIGFQLERLQNLHERLAVIFIKDSRSGVFLFDKDGPLLFADSHPYGSGGAMLVCTSDVSELVMLLVEVLHVVSLEGLGTLTPIYFN